MFFNHSVAQLRVEIYCLVQTLTNLQLLTESRADAPKHTATIASGQVVAAFDRENGYVRIKQSDGWIPVDKVKQIAFREHHSGCFSKLALDFQCII